jgi:hypothetical protein
LYEKALHIDKDLAARDPGSRQHHLDIIGQLAALADNEERADRFAEAARWLQESTAIYTRLEREKPLPPFLQQARQYCLQDLAAYSAAARGLDDSNVVLKQPAKLAPDLLRLRALRLARRREHQEATATAEQLRKGAPLDLRAQIAVSRVYALCARDAGRQDSQVRQRYIERSLEILGAVLRQVPQVAQGSPLEPDFLGFPDQRHLRELVRQANSIKPPAR